MIKIVINKQNPMCQWLACVLILAMAVIPMPVHGAGGSTINTVVTGAESSGVTVESDGSVYYMSFVDANKNCCFINKRTPDGNATRVAGGGTLAGGGMASGVNADQAFVGYTWETVPYNGSILFSDTGSMRIRSVSGGKVYNIVGDGTNYSDVDGVLTESTRICGPKGLAVDGSGSIYFAESGANKIRKVYFFQGIRMIGTVVGNNTEGGLTAGYSGDGGPATAARLENPSGIALDASGNLYIADTGNHVIREVAASDHTQYGIAMQAGCIYTIAGGGSNGDGIQAATSQLYYPRDVVVDDSGNLYIAELHRIRKVDTDGVISTIAGSTIVGDSGNSGDFEDDASDALLNNPCGIALDGNGNLLIADTNNGKIRKVTFGGAAPSPEITTSTMPSGSVGTTYYASLTASGGSGVYTDWSASGLPDGLHITSTGKIRGVPQNQGTYNVSVTVTDSNQAAITKSIELSIAPASQGYLNTWQEVNEPSLADIPINDIIYGENGFVGIGVSGAVILSTNGAAWTADATTTGAGVVYRGVAYGEGTYAAVGEDDGKGLISTKTGLGAWSTMNLQGIDTLNCVTYAGGSTFIAGGSTILISNNLGVTWNAVNAANLPSVGGGATFSVYGIAADGNGHIVAAGEASNGHSILWYSSDNGASWSATASLIEVSCLNSVAFGNNVFVAMGYDGIAFISGNEGSTWESAEIPGVQDAFPPVINKVVFSNNTFVAVGLCEQGQYNVISSEDNGLTWTERVSNPDIDFQSVAWGNNGFVSAGYTAPGMLGRLFQSAPMTPLSILTTNLSGGTAGTAYNFTLFASGGIAPYTWSALGLPNGLALSSDGLIGGTLPAAGTFDVTITVHDSQSNAVSELFNLTIEPAAPVEPTNPSNPTNPGSGTSSGGGDGTAPSKPSSTQVLDSEGKPLQSVTSNFDSSTGTVSVAVTSDLLTAAFNSSKTDEEGVKNIEIVIPRIDGAKAYETSLPVSALTSDNTDKTIELKTDIATVTVPGNMLTDTADAGAQKVSISISSADKSKLDEALQEEIGNRPVVELALKLDGRKASWSNENAPVTVSIPYTPTTEELNDPEHIVIWYIDGSGKAISVPSGHYDPATGTVTFTSTHFSYYAVGYNKTSFKDVPENAWFNEAVGFIAARNITTGVGAGNFSPQSKLTRGEFLVLMMRAYDIAPDQNPKDNFADAGSSYYTGYLAAAKRLSITEGTGNNMFAPNQEITRQELFVLLFNTLKSTDRLPQRNSSNTLALSDFTDFTRVSSWAVDAITLMVETGVINGNGGKLLPKNTTSRAEMAQVLYNLLSK